MRDWSPHMQTDVAMLHLIGAFDDKALFGQGFGAEASKPV